MTLTFELKIGTEITPTLGNDHTNFGFPAICTFCVMSQYKSTGQTDRQIDGRNPITGLSLVFIQGLLRMCGTLY